MSWLKRAFSYEDKNLLLLGQLQKSIECLQKEGTTANIEFYNGGEVSYTNGYSSPVTYPDFLLSIQIKDESFLACIENGSFSVFHQLIGQQSIKFTSESLAEYLLLRFAEKITNEKSNVLQKAKQLACKPVQS